MVGRLYNGGCIRHAAGARVHNAEARSGFDTLVGVNDIIFGGA